MALTLTACAHSGSKPVETPRLAEIPGDLRACFDRLVPPPAGGDLTKQQIFEKIAELRKSDKAKSQCGKRLIAFYEGQK